jgi:hypothetical protein
MSREMGADRDSLINQALFMYARLNGFLTPENSSSPRAAAARVDPLSPARQGTADMGAASRGTPAAAAAAGPVAGKTADRAPAAPRGPVRSTDQRPATQAPAAAPVSAPAPPPAAPPPAASAPVAPPPPPAAPAASSRDRQLYLVTENGEAQRIENERFLIGRDKKCDFVINSGKVSREHAMLTREADGWYLQDLNSSNGTWFQQERIDRRKVEDGDVYYICNEKITVMFR